MEMAGDQTGLSRGDDGAARRRFAIREIGAVDVRTRNIIKENGTLVGVWIKREDTSRRTFLNESELDWNFVT
jgi:hypothetical protein